MVKVRLVSTLKEKFGKEEIEVNAEDLRSLIKFLSNKVPDIADFEGRPSGLYLLLINDVDARVYGENPKITEDSIVTVIPVNHGG